MKTRFVKAFITYAAIVIISIFLNNPQGGKIIFDGFTTGREYHIKDSRCFRANYISKEAKKTYIVFPRLDVNAMKVYVNGNLVFSVGDRNAASKLWSQTIAIPVVFKSGNNDIKLCVQSAGTMRMLVNPFVSENPWIYVWVAKIFYLYFSYFAFAFSLITGVFFLIISFWVEKERLLFTLMGFTGILIGLFFNIIGFYINAFPFPFHILLSKIWIVSLLPAMLFYYLSLRAVSGVSNVKIGYESLGIIGILAFASFVFVKQPVLAKIMTTTLPLILPLLLLYPYIQLVKKKDEIFLVPITILMISSVHYYFSILVVKYNYPILVYGLTYNMGAFVNYYMKKFQQLMISSEYDELTGANVRNTLKKLEYTGNDVIAFVDINDFKKYNDNFGHEKGDEVLKDFVYTVKRNIKGNDLIIRYGGDEFVIVFRNCSKKNARAVMNKINSEFKKKFPSGISYGIERFVGDMKATIESADGKMYMMKAKEKKRNETG